MKNDEYWRQRAIDSEQYAHSVAESEIKRQRKLYKRAYDEIVDKIDDLYIQIADFGITPTRTQLWQMKKYIELERQLSKELGNITTSQIKGTEEALTKVVEHTLDTTIGDLKQQGAVSSGFNVMPEKGVKKYVNSVWNDTRFSRKYAENGIKIGERIKREISNMVVWGKNPSTIKKELQNDLNMSFNAADRLVRTEAAHFYNDTNMTCYKEAGVEEVEYIAVGDGRICDTCAGYASEKYFKITEAPVLPVHPNCRCCYAAVTKYDEKVVNGEKDDILKNNISNEGKKKLSVDNVGKLDKKYIEDEFGILKTDEVIVTDERRKHVKMNHPQDYALFDKYKTETVNNPDLILKDNNHENTIFMIKKADDTNVNVIIRLALLADSKANKEYKNSVISFYRVRDKNVEKLKAKHKVLYNRE